MILTAYKENIKKVPHIVFDFMFECWASFHAYMIVLSEPYDGKIVLLKEPLVRNELEKIIEHADQYSMKAYERTAVSYKAIKSRTTTHRFFVITREGEKYQTLSFSATGKGAFSEGAWTINTDSDIASYEDYLSGENKWKVTEIKTSRGINTRETITKVKAKLDSDITYYFKAQVNDNDNKDNCSTALLETLSENR
jgi:hypothetical protein